MGNTNYRVRITFNYQTFNKLIGNRNTKSTNAIKASIEEVGQVPIPIIVNEKYEVIDGQHRLEVFEKLGLPVYYLVIPDIGTKEAACINNAQKKWSTEDYLYSYAEQGNPSYIYVVDLLKKYKKTSASEILAIASGTIMTGGGYVPGFKNGKLAITERQKEILEATLPELDELSSIIKSVGGQRRTFVTAMSWLLNFSSADKNRLMKCVREKYSLIRPVADKFSLLRDLEDIYNKNIRTPGNRVYFEAEYKEYLISRENQK